MTRPAHKGASILASEWLASAASDLSAARHCRGQVDVAPELVCFHAQQCAEKALKAVMINPAIPATILPLMRPKLGMLSSWPLRYWNGLGQTVAASALAHVPAR